MHDLEPLTPLGSAEPIVEHYGPITLTEVTDAALVSVTARLGREAETESLLARMLGGSSPQAGHLSGSDMAAFWMGPDQWMVEAPIAAFEDLAAHVAVLAMGAASVTGQTDAWCRFDLTGDGLADVFERLCCANTRAFTGGEAVRTTIDHLGCFLVCRAPGAVSVLGPRSAAGSLHHALVTALRSAQ